MNGVVHVAPNHYLGDVSDIETARAGDAWHVVFRKAWGDCPSGCMFRVLTFFTVADGRVERIAAAQARAMEPFAAILADRDWR